MEKLNWCDHSAKSAFNAPYIPDEFVVEGLDRPHPRSPIINPSYYFRESLLRDMLVFWGSGDIAMWLNGHAGSGKATIVEQFHARLNLPLFVFSASKRTEASELLIRTIPTENGWKVTKGVLLRAMEEGASLLIDEYNLIAPGEASGLNQVLQGGQIEVPELETVVRPARGFRVFVACNPADGSGHYHDRHVQDGANGERYWFVNVDYPKPEEEIPLVAGELINAGFPAQAAPGHAEALVKVANALRARFIGSNDGADAIEATMSTRTLLRWARLQVLYAAIEAKGEQPIHYALQRAMTNNPSISPETVVAIHTVVEQITGAEYKVT